MAVDYLRISLTDRCNLNCVYCSPRDRKGCLSHDELLRHEELARAAAAFVRAGVSKVRLTGGEPLLRKNLPGLVRLLRAIPGLNELALTTNGILLGEQAVPLREAGLDRVNISLDSLRPEVFRSITGSDSLEAAMAGVMAALRAGFSEVKLNVVVMKGVNDAEIADLAGLSVDLPLTVRFIEFFPANGRSGPLNGALVTTADARKRIEEVWGPLTGLAPSPSDGPARVFRRPGARGKIGFISGRSDYFCGSCNRVRMDCVGRIYPCLFSPATRDVKGLLRSGASDAELDDCLKKAFSEKPGYRKDSPTAGCVEMSSLGG